MPQGALARSASVLGIHIVSHVNECFAAQMGSQARQATHIAVFRALLMPYHLYMNGMARQIARVAAQQIALAAYMSVIEQVTLKT